MSASFKLPNGWTETPFAAVVSPVSVNDKKLPRGQYLESGRSPVVDQGQQFIGGYSDDEARVVSEDLPLLVFGDHTRGFKYLNQPFVPGAHGVKVLKPHGVDAKWLYEIVDQRLSVVEKLESVVTANLQGGTRLRQSILQKAFTGRLFETERSTL